MPMFRKGIGDPSRVSPIDDIQATEKSSYGKQPMIILDWQVRRSCAKGMASVKTSWRNNIREEMKNTYSYLFPMSSDNLNSKIGYGS